MHRHVDSSRFGAYRIENVHLRTSSEQRQEIVQFWLRERAIPTLPEAVRRAHEVCLLVRRDDGTGVLAGVSTVGRMRTRSGLIYWVFRMFLRKPDRVPRLSLAVANATCAHLRLRARREGDAAGMLIVTENVKLMRPGARMLFQRQGCRYVGRNARGQDVWVVDFPAHATAAA